MNDDIGELSNSELVAEMHRLAVIWNQAELRKAELRAELEKRGIKSETLKGGVQ